MTSRAGWYDGRAQTANAIAYALGQENPRFDRARFLATCGVTP
jgi:hypothetical protein